MIGDIYKSSTPVSSYQPSKEISDLTSYVQKDYSKGVEILNRPWVELNERSVIDDMNRGQRMANAFVDENIEDPAQAWKWRGTRSKARNKGLGMHAQLTAAFMIPGFSAQNDADEVDREFGNTMRDIVEWMTLPTNSDYQSSFLELVTGMIESPVVFLGAEYCEVFQTIREKIDKGYSKTEILDEVLSGYRAPVFTADQILISNVYERNIQKHRGIIKRVWIEYGEAEAKYGKHENWTYVQPGVKSVYNGDDGLFYDTKDDEHEGLVAVETAMYRREDTEVVFVNGIYMSESNVENNPIKHRDNRNAPKYNVVPFGYNRIGTHFFYYKSMMNAVGWDNQLYDAMSEVIMNNAFLEMDPPTAISGQDKVDTDVNFPGAVLAFADKDVKTQAIFPAKNFAAGFQALMATDASIQEATLSDTQMGQLPEASQKAFTVAQAEANAKKLIKGTAQTLAESVVQYGPLMADIAINHLTAPQVDEIVGDSTKVKYRKFLLEKQVINGKQVDKEIRFEDSLVGSYGTKEDNDRMSLQLLEETDYPETKKHIVTINPHLFSKFRFLCRIDPEEMFPKNSDAMSALLTSLYQLLANDPMVEHEALLRKLMYSYFKGEGEDLIAKNQPNPIAMAAGQPQGGGLPEQVRQKQISTAVQGVAAQ